MSDDDNVTPFRPNTPKTEPPVDAVRIDDDDLFRRPRTMSPDMDDEDLMQGATKLIVWQRNGDNVPVSTEYNFVHHMRHDDDNTLHFFHIVLDKNRHPSRKHQQDESGLDLAERARNVPGARYLRRVINNGEWCDLEYEDFYIYTRKKPHQIIEDVGR